MSSGHQVVSAALSAGAGNTANLNPRYSPCEEGRPRALILRFLSRRPLLCNFLSLPYGGRRGLLILILNTGFVLREIKPSPSAIRTRSLSNVGLERAGWTRFMLGSKCGPAVVSHPPCAHPRGLPGKPQLISSQERDSISDFLGHFTSSALRPQTDFSLAKRPLCWEGVCPAPLVSPHRGSTFAASLLPLGSGPLILRILTLTCAL